MKPVKPVKATLADKATLVDLLDRMLDKGVLLNADILITVAGVPLLAANLRLALASVEKMLEYGMMRDWDAAVRTQNSGLEKVEKEKQVVTAREL